MVISSITRWMVSEFYNLKMVSDMRDNGLITKNMALDNISGLMDASIRVVIPMEREMVRVK